jgi:hypothetical protein
MIKMNVWSNPKVLIDQQRDAQTGAMWHVITLSATKNPIEYVLWIIAHGFLMRIYNQRMDIMTRIWIVLELSTAPILLSHAPIQAGKHYPMSRCSNPQEDRMW